MNYLFYGCVPVKTMSKWLIEADEPVKTLLSMFTVAVYALDPGGSGLSVNAS